MTLHLITTPVSHEATAKRFDAYALGFRHGQKEGHPYAPQPWFDSPEKLAYENGFDDASDMFEGVINQHY